MCFRYKYNPQGFDSGGWNFEKNSGRRVAEYLMEQLAKINLRPSNPSIFLEEKKLAQPGEPTQEQSEVFPGDMAQILIHDEERGRLLIPSSYGLLPKWLAERQIQKGNKLKYLYNCRDDSLSGPHMKPSFRDAFFRRRCLAGVSVIVENLGKRQWLEVRPSEGDQFVIAGLFDFPHQYAPSFTHCLVTTSPNERILQHFDRMPVILDRPGAEVWLDPKSTKDELLALLKPAPVEWIGEITIRTEDPPDRKRKQQSEDLGFDFEE